jgi:peroxiredoxin
LIIKEKRWFSFTPSTPGCTAEGLDLRDNFERFEANNYALLVSADATKKLNLKKI